MIDKLTLGVIDTNDWVGIPPPKFVKYNLIASPAVGAVKMNVCDNIANVALVLIVDCGIAVAVGNVFLRTSNKVDKPPGLFNTTKKFTS